MSSEFTERALAIFREAIERPEAERAGFLDTACGTNTALRAKVETMLQFDSEDDDVPQPMRAALSEIAAQTGVDDGASAPTPTDIGGYRVTRRIARGGMGDVYEAWQKNPERRVAIKVARTTGTTGESARRFELEAQLLARLSHPRIAQIIEAGTTTTDAGAQPFFVMEYVEGQSLKDYATAHLTDTRSRLELMVALCEAVGFAHGQGVIHRDLKPDNVLIGDDGLPKVLDFGVAKVESAGGFGAATLRTEAGRIIGTLGYMAPEQMAGTSDGLGPQADVYSLGVMIYELLSGRLPHDLDAVTLTRALAVVTTTDAPLLGVIRPEYRGDIEAVVAKALEKVPHFRYADATALQQDLERFLRGEPTLARPAGPVRRLTKWTRRNPALAAAVFGGFVLLASTAAILLVTNREIRQKNEQVQTTLDDFGRLADARRLDALRDLAVDAAKLWPTRARARELEEWLEAYGKLAAKSEDHRGAVRRLGAAGSFASEQAEWQYDQLVNLVDDLDAFAGKDGKDGLAIEVQRRLELARNIEKITCTDRGADWHAAIVRIKDPESKYKGLVIKPQVGLIPLGPDPDSGLEEFLHLETHRGAIPAPGNGERIPLPPGNDTGLVFVLLPGGDFWMGAEANPPRHPDGPNGGPNSDPDVLTDPGPLFKSWEKSYPVEGLMPFFMSKYEMTEGQWEFFVGQNQNAMPTVPSEPPFRSGGPNRPVNNVSFEQCIQVMRRLGLMLPDEEQWEYAARAGTKQAFWTGSDPNSLNGAENVFEMAAARKRPKWYPKKERVEAAPFTDELKAARLLRGDERAAPVGSYRANGFGLFDVAGNLSEYTSTTGRFGGRCIVRGSNYGYGVFHARSASRTDVPIGFGAPMLGFRPAAAIQE